jgi:hypothetical protein
MNRPVCVLLVLWKMVVGLTTSFYWVHHLIVVDLIRRLCLFVLWDKKGVVMTNPWWICNKCGSIEETREGHRPARLSCKCGGEIVPDYSAEEDYENEVCNIEHEPCPDDAYWAAVRATNPFGDDTIH